MSFCKPLILSTVVSTTCWPIYPEPNGSKPKSISQTTGIEAAPISWVLTNCTAIGEKGLDETQKKKNSPTGSMSNGSRIVIENENPTGSVSNQMWKRDVSINYAQTAHGQNAIFG